MSNESNTAFNKALSNFVHDFASGGAIRHLADSGLTVTEITARLSFPTPKSRVAQAVWDYYLETGKICLEQPVRADVIRKVTYVKEQNAYGKVSMRQVVEEVPVEHREYLACDFGRQIYRDREGFQRKLSVLTDREREYILGLPWPLQTVYHEADERMRGIMRKLAADNVWGQ